MPGSYRENDEARMSNVDGRLNAQRTKVLREMFSHLDHMSHHSCAKLGHSFVIRHSSSSLISVVILGSLLIVRRSALQRRDDLRTWFRATGLHQRVRSRRSILEQQLAERGSPEQSGADNHAKSYKCPSKPGATQTNHKKSQGLPRTPLKTFPLREGRYHEGPVLGLSRSQNA